MSGLSRRVKCALVTGGSEGLGFCVARLLSERGYRVTIVARGTLKLRVAASHLSGTDHHHLALDLATRAGAEQLVRLVEEKTFNVLVNNAGASRFGAVTAFDSDAVERTLQLNLETPALLGWAFVRSAQPGSVLVNVTSIVGTVPVPGNSLYCAAKAGLQVLTECQWYEARKKGVRVLDFRPAGLKTSFHRVAGGSSMSGGMAVTAEVAGQDLVKAIEGSRDFVYIYGVFAKALEWMRRLLPKRFMIIVTGRKSERAGYF